MSRFKFFKNIGFNYLYPMVLLAPEIIISILTTRAGYNDYKNVQRQIKGFKEKYPGVAWKKEICEARLFGKYKYEIVATDDSNAAPAKKQV